MYESRNQTCTVALIEWLIEENKIKLDKAFVELLKSDDESHKVISIREEYTYGIGIRVQDEKRIEELIDMCKELIDETKNILFEQENSPKK